MLSSTFRAAGAAGLAYPPGGVKYAITFHSITWAGLNSVLDTVTPRVTASQVSAQVVQLNADFAGSGIQFVGGALRTYEDAAWTANCFDSLPAIYAAVNTAPAAAVNVVLCDLTASGNILGVTPGVPNGGANETSPSQVVVVDYR